MYTSNDFNALLSYSLLVPTTSQDSHLKIKEAANQEKIKIDAAVDAFIQKAKDPHDDNMLALRQMGNFLKAKLDSMARIGCTAQDIRETSNKGLEEIERTAVHFIANTSISHNTIRKLNNQFNEIDSKIHSRQFSKDHFSFNEQPLREKTETSKGQPTPSLNLSFNSILQVTQEKISFSDRRSEKLISSNPSQPKIDMDVKKTQFARCVQSSMDPESPFGAMPCLAHHSKGLSEAEKKELNDFAPKAVTGKVINELAVVPAVISKTVNLAFNAFAWGAFAEACAETPHLYHELMKQGERTLNGENPKFNEFLKEATPNAMLHAGAAMKRWNDQITQLDLDMQLKYRTIPGIVHDGISGSAELAAMAAIGPAMRGSLIMTKSAFRLASASVRGVHAAFQTIANSSESLYLNLLRASVGHSLQPMPALSSRNVVYFLKNEVGTFRFPAVESRITKPTVSSSPSSISNKIVEFMKDEAGTLRIPPLNQATKTKPSVANSSSTFKNTPAPITGRPSQSGPPYVLLTDAEEIAARRALLESDKGHAIAVEKRKNAQRQLALKDRKSAETLAETFFKEKQQNSELNRAIVRNHKISKMVQQDRSILQEIPEIKNMPTQFSNLPINFTSNFVQRERFLFQEAGKDILFFFPLTLNKKFTLKECVEAAFAFAARNNKARVFMCWDPSSRTLASTVNAQKTIIGAGELSRGKDIFPLKVIETSEIAVKSKMETIGLI